MKRILLITAVFGLISGQADARGCAFYVKEACATPTGFKDELDKQNGCLTPVCVKSFCTNMASIGCPSNPDVKRLVIDHCFNKDSGLKDEELSGLRKCTIVADIPHQDFAAQNKAIVQHLQADGQKFAADGAALLEAGRKAGREDAAEDIIEAVKAAQEQQFESAKGGDDGNPRRKRRARRPSYSNRYSYDRGGY